MVLSPIKECSGLDSRCSKFCLSLQCKMYAVLYFAQQYCVSLGMVNGDLELPSLRTKQKLLAHKCLQNLNRYWLSSHKNLQKSPSNMLRLKFESLASISEFQQNQSKLKYICVPVPSEENRCRKWRFLEGQLKTIENRIHIAKCNRLFWCQQVWYNKWSKVKMFGSKFTIQY